MAKTITTAPLCVVGQMADEASTPLELNTSSPEDSCCPTCRRANRSRQVIAPPHLHALTSLRAIAMAHPAFGDLGLIMPSDPSDALTRWEYWCTPTNAWTFATTGGNGVHYSLVETEGSVSEQSPVVMTVPMCDSPNHIVGADLREFLALGLPYGWFGLEQMAYSSSWWEDHADWEREGPMSPERRAVIAELQERLGLVGWEDVPDRLLHLSVLSEGLRAEG